MVMDADFDFYVKRSEAFEAEVKNLLKITIPKIDTPTADYLAKRIDLKRMEYERVLVDRFIGLVDERKERK